MKKYITQHARSAVAPLPIHCPHGSLLRQVIIVLLLCCTAVSPLLRRCYLLLNSRSASAVRLIPHHGLFLIRRCRCRPILIRCWPLLSDCRPLSC